MQKSFNVTDDLLASKGQRFLNYIIDLIAQYAIAFAVGITAVFVAELSGMYGFVDWIQGMNTIEEYLLGAVILIIYYSIIEIIFAQSLGKAVTKTMVVMHDGSKPDSGTILRRTFCRLIPLNHFSFLGNPSRGWHDSISDTYVVDKQKLEERMNLHSAFEELGQNGGVSNY